MPTVDQHFTTLARETWPKARVTLTKCGYRLSGTGEGDTVMLGSNRGDAFVNVRRKLRDRGLSDGAPVREVGKQLRQKLHVALVG